MQKMGSRPMPPTGSPPVPLPRTPTITFAESGPTTGKPAIRPGITRGLSATFGRTLNRTSTSLKKIRSKSIRLQQLGMIASTLSSLREEVNAKAEASDLRATANFLLEFTEYAVFLLVLIVVAINMNGLRNAFPTVSNLRNVVLGNLPFNDPAVAVSEDFFLYQRVETQADVWSYLRNQLGDNLFAADDATEAEARTIVGGDQYKIGAVRIVTARVEAYWGDCVELPVYRDFADEPRITSCFPQTFDDPRIWDGSPFGTPEGHFRVNETLFDRPKLREQQRRVDNAARVSALSSGFRRQLRAGGGGDGASRKTVAEGTGGERVCPEAKLFKMDVRSDMRRSEWRAYVDELRVHGLLDRQSRVLEVLFTLYNVNANLYTTATIDITMPYTGGVFGAATFWTVEPVRHLTFISRRGRKLFPMPGVEDGFLLAAELLYLLLVLRTLSWEVSKALQYFVSVCGDYRRSVAAHGGRSSLWQRLQTVSGLVWALVQGLQLWSVIQLLSLGLHLLVIVRRYSTLNKLLELELAPKAWEFMDMHRLTDEMFVTQNIVSLNVLFSFLSLFKFATVVPQLSMLNQTIATAFPDLLGFSLMFAIVFVGFAQGFQLAFGSTMLSFASPRKAFYELFAVMAGNVNFEELRNANRFLGPLLFFGYAVLVIFVLLNMFVAIVTSSYTKAKRRMKEDPTTGKLYRTIRFTVSLVYSVALKQYKFLVLAVRSRKTQLEIGLAIQDGVVTLFELAEILNGSGLGDKSAIFPSWLYWSSPDLVMKRYDPDGNGWLSKDELEQLQADMAAESDERKRILEQDFAENDESTRVDRECARRMRVYIALSKKVDALVVQHTKLLQELDSSRATIHTELKDVTSKLWKIWEKCDLI